MAIPVASTTAIVTDLFGTFWDVLSGSGVYVLGGLISVGIIFWAFRLIMRKMR